MAAKILSTFHDWRDQFSWGRVCAAVALVVAVWREFTGADLAHVGLWLGVALGNYGVSKLVEARCSKSPNPGPSAPAAGESAASTTTTLPEAL